MKNLMFILCLLTISSGCQKSDTKGEPNGVFLGKAFLKATVIKSNNEIVHLNSEYNVEIDFDNKIMKSDGPCKNSVQIVDNESIIFGKAIDNFSHFEDAACLVSNDTAKYIINNDILSISFKTTTKERQYNYTERDITTRSCTMELMRK